ncbi:MAG: ABC transporter ATP-binding protein [Bacilli bacterium]|nr:ABC transporter ATP-binding protein [Bacilli bacterium]
MPRGFIPKAKFEKGEARKIFARFFKMTLANHKFLVVLALLCIALSALSSVMGSMFLKSLINDYITPLKGVTDPDFAPLIHALVRMAAIYLVGVFAIGCQALIMNYLSNSSLLTMRTALFSHMEQLPIKYFDARTHGEVMSHYTNDVDTLYQMVSQALPSVVSSVISITMILVSMIILNPLLTVVVIVIYVAITFIVKKISSYASKYYKLQHAATAKLNGYMEEMITGQKVVKVFCHENESVEGFKTLNDDLAHVYEEAQRSASILMPMMNNLGHFTYAIIAVCGAALAVSGTMNLDLGTIAAFLLLTRSFSQPISQVSQQFAYIISGIAGAKRVFALLDEPVEQDNGNVELVNAKKENDTFVETKERTGIWAWKVPSENGTSYVEVKGDVRFKDVDFGYVEDKIVLHDVSLFAKPGQKIAFVGHTGAGKTTITNLINRFYDINKGEITFDGINIQHIKKPDLRHALAMVLQDTNLFTGTVKDNIRFGRLKASDEEIIEAAKLANADDFISKLEKGYDTMLTNNGSNLSQGQRQLLSIARAEVANCPVLILDEATSSIDTRTEQIIQSGMDNLMANRTVFVIAHRLSTVRNSKAILVIDEGRIIERGSHQDLLKEKGMYYELYTGASELE